VVKPRQKPEAIATDQNRIIEAVSPTRKSTPNEAIGNILTTQSQLGAWFNYTAQGAFSMNANQRTPDNSYSIHHVISATPFVCERVV